MTVSGIITNPENAIKVFEDWSGIPEDDRNTLFTCLNAAKNYVMSYTGLTLEELDKHEDITIAFIGVVNDFYTNNRPDTAQIAINPMSRNILNMHSKNLL